MPRSDDTSKRDPKKTRDRILRASAGIFTNKGFDGARTGEIAKAAGVPQGLLYHHFKNKAGLFRATLENALAPFAEMSGEFLSGEPNADGWPEFLASGIREYFDFLKKNPNIPRLVGWWRIRSRHEEEPDLATSLSLDVRGQGAARIRQAQESGWVRDDLDPMTVIDLAVSLCMMWHQSWEVTANQEGIDIKDPQQVEALHEQRLKDITHALLEGLLVKNKA